MLETRISSISLPNHPAKQDISDSFMQKRQKSKMEKPAYGFFLAISEKVTDIPGIFPEKIFILVASKKGFLLQKFLFDCIFRKDMIW
jgi:hypothetical protein